LILFNRNAYWCKKGIASARTSTVASGVVVAQFDIDPSPANEAKDSAPKDGNAS
jgi:hypothetical protein